MKGGYTDETITSLVRDFECLEDSVRLTDIFEFSEMPTAIAERFVSLLPIEENADGLVCGDSIMVFNKDAFDISFSSEIVARKRSIKETVYYVDLIAKKLDKNMTFTFEFK